MKKNGVNDMNKYKSTTTTVHMNWFSNASKSVSKQIVDEPSTSCYDSSTKINVMEVVGSGSYGTVRMCQIVNDATNRDDDHSDTGIVKNDDENIFIAKRAWSLEDLVMQEGKQNGGQSEDSKKLENRAKRCAYYLDVEQHCLEKLKSNEKNSLNGSKIDHIQRFPNLVGKFSDVNNGGNEWLVFDFLSRSGGVGNKKQPARTLREVIDQDWNEQHTNTSTDSSTSYSYHHLHKVQLELGLPHDATFGDTLDVCFKELLRAVTTVHRNNVVHRDIKPDNLLIDPLNHSFVLIDFGSAADMDPTSSKKNMLGFGGRIGLDDGNGDGVLIADNIVALSPIYAAPETFIKWDRAPLNFDTFSVGLIFCQLMFNLLDERMDAAFHQQLRQAGHDLDLWLERSLTSTLRPDGLDGALMYMGERPGLWKLVSEMLHPNQEVRKTSIDALRNFEQILYNMDNDDIAEKDLTFDGPYFTSVLSSLESCEISNTDEEIRKKIFEDLSYTADDTTIESRTQPNDFLILPRPLHFVATFERSVSLGLILSEPDEADENMDEDARLAWDRGIAGAQPGEVFIREIIEGGQAEEMGIFEIGDRIRSIAEIPFVSGGFGKVLDMLQAVPKNSKTVKIHFDRKPASIYYEKNKPATHSAKLIGQGAWSSKGMRTAQEDAIVLQEIGDRTNGDVVIAGVFDGHGGDAASKTASQLMPSLFANELSLGGGKGDQNITQALSNAWNDTCESYREGCTIYGECVADFDPIQGIILAGTGSKDLVAGTTASVVTFLNSLDGTDEVTILNCGDSRTLVVASSSGANVDHQLKNIPVIQFVTRDHAPKDKEEAERLLQGKEAGLGFSQPQCSVSRWWLKVGDYQYAISRSLEGIYATSKGIISTPDISKISLTGILNESELATIIIASDGLFEVMDDEEVGREVLKMRYSGMSAEENAKNMCNLAMKKRTSDNVSVIVLYFE